MNRNQSLAAALLLGLAALAAAPCPAALRVTPEAGPAFVLLPLATDGDGPWYDAEEWLGRFPGVLTTDPDRGRLTYRLGGRTAVLNAQPPYAQRDGQALGDGPPPRLVDGRLAVSERFLLERAGDFLGLKVAVERPHGTGALRVILDPGHGGDDEGSRAPAAPPEKDVALRLAQEAAAALRRRGFEVKLTREDDRPLTGLDRAAAANRWEADLFLSLHASGAERPQARGFEVFVPAPSSEDPRLWSGGQAGRAPDSRRWGEAVQTALGQLLPTFDRGVRRLPSPVLEAVAGPACLLEAGNLSWPEDAEPLLKAKGRAALAEALAAAAESYFGAPHASLTPHP